MDKQNILQTVTYREPTLADAEVLKSFGEQILAETDFFLHEPGDRAKTVDDMKTVIQAFENSPNSLMLGAWIGDVPVGEGVLIGGQLNRTRHTASLGIGVAADYHGTGVAERLMLGMETWAVASGICRIELTVMTHNTKARKFYDRLGYKEEGVKRGSASIDGQWIDEYLMSKLFGDVADQR